MRLRARVVTLSPMLSAHPLIRLSVLLIWLMLLRLAVVLVTLLAGLRKMWRSAGICGLVMLAVSLSTGLMVLVFRLLLTRLVCLRARLVTMPVTWFLRVSGTTCKWRLRLTMGWLSHSARWKRLLVILRRGRLLTLLALPLA